MVKQGRPSDHEQLLKFVEGMQGRTLVEALGLSTTHFRCSNCGRIARLDRMEWSGPDGWVHANRVECYLFDRDYRRVA